MSKRSNERTNFFVNLGRQVGKIIAKTLVPAYKIFGAKPAKETMKLSYDENDEVLRKTLILENGSFSPEPPKECVHPDCRLDFPLSTVSTQEEEQPKRKYTKKKRMKHNGRNHTVTSNSDKA